MRKAAAGWEDDYAERFGKVGFARGKGVPTSLYNKTTGVRVVVHGDDFTFSGTRRQLEKVRKLMAEWYDVKDRGIMGSGNDEI